MSEQGSPRHSYLRVSYVWHGEVMADVVVREPHKVTLGSSKSATLTTPDLGLPADFVIVRPTARGYVLTLGQGMTGRIQLGGEEFDIARFVSQGGGGPEGAQGAFRATSVEPGDWGVVHLDGHGDNTFFFQYVKPDRPLPRHGVRDSHLLIPAIFFAVILHGVFVVMALREYTGSHSFVFPGKRELMADYLLVRPQPPAPEVNQPRAGEEDANEEAPPQATVGKEGKSGGEGEQPRAKAPDPDKGDPEGPPPEVQVGLLSKRSRTQMRKVLDRGGFDEKLGNAVERLKGPKLAGSLGGSGDGSGTGLGPGQGGSGTSTRGGKGTGGGGKNVGDVQTHGPIHTGGTRAARGTPGGKGVKEAKVQVSTGKPSGELGGLTKAEIYEVVKSRERAIAKCYDRVLQTTKGLGGKVVLTWKITASGKVSGAKVRSTTVKNGRVEDCIVRQIQMLKFPEPRGGQVARVNFPFVFASR